MALLLEQHFHQNTSTKEMYMDMTKLSFKKKRNGLYSDKQKHICKDITVVNRFDTASDLTDLSESHLLTTE